MLYSSKLHSEARRQMEALLEYMTQAERRLQREVNDLNDLRSVMSHLRDIRDRESGIQMEIAPVMDMYRLLEQCVSISIARVNGVCVSAFSDFSFCAPRFVWGYWLSQVPASQYHPKGGNGFSLNAYASVACDGREGRSRY